MYKRQVERSLKDNGVYIFDIVDREFMNEMFPNDLFVDDRKDLTCIWEHEIEDVYKRQVMVWR